MGGNISFVIFFFLFQSNIFFGALLPEILKKSFGLYTQESLSQPRYVELLCFNVNVTDKIEDYRFLFSTLKFRVPASQTFLVVFGAVM